MSSWIAVNRKAQPPQKNSGPRPGLSLISLWGNPGIVPAEWRGVSVPVRVCASSGAVPSFGLGFFFFFYSSLLILVLSAPSSSPTKQLPSKKKKEKNPTKPKQTKLGKVFRLLLPFHFAFNKGWWELKRQLEIEKSTNL